LTSEQRTFDDLEDGESSFELRDVTTHIVDSEHKSAPESEEGYPYVKTSDIENGRINFDDVSYVDEEAYKEWTRRLTPEPGDIILTREAPVGRVGLISEGKQICLGQRTVLIRPDPEKLDNQYLRYLLLSDEVQHRFDSLSTGSTVDHLNLEDLRSFDLPELPGLEEQKKIGRMLSNFDEKIETSKVLLELLEEIAQTIFENRFVDYEPYDSFQDSEIGEVPVGFEIVEVDDIVWSGRGYSYTSEYLDKENELEESYPMINLMNVKEGGGFQTDGYKYYTEEDIKDRYHIEQGDLVVAITEQTLDGSLIGSPALIPQINAEKSIISQDLAKIVPDGVSKVFLHHLFNTKRFDEYTTSVATGTTVYHLSLTSIGEFKFALPPKEDIEEFTAIASKIHEHKHLLIEGTVKLHSRNC